MDVTAKRNSLKTFWAMPVTDKKQMIVHNSSKLVWSFVRMVLIFGVCFIILHPLFTKFTVSIMSEKDLYDTTVMYVPRASTFQNYIVALQGMDYFATFFRTMSLSLLSSVLQLASCALVAYGFARF